MQACLLRVDVKAANDSFSWISLIIKQVTLHCFLRCHLCLCLSARFMDSVPHRKLSNESGTAGDIALCKKNKRTSYRHSYAKPCKGSVSIPYLRAETQSVTVNFVTALRNGRHSLLRLFGMQYSNAFSADHARIYGLQRYLKPYSLCCLTAGEEVVTTSRRQPYGTTRERCNDVRFTV